jgi:hypothetical protein
MLNYSDVYIYTDQPATCPKCGARTEITLELNDAPDYTQYHKCLSSKCDFEFVMQEDYENDVK